MVLILEDVCAGLLLIILECMCTMTINLDWGRYLSSCFVVMGGKDMRNPTLIVFYRAVETMST